jgi:hypothetical protein
VTDWLWKIIGLQKMVWCKTSLTISRFKTKMGTLKNTLKKTTFCNTLPMILIEYGNHRMAWRIRKNCANFPISIHLEFHCRKGLVPMMEWLELGIHSKHHQVRCSCQTEMTEAFHELEESLQVIPIFFQRMCFSFSDLCFGKYFELMGSDKIRTALPSYRCIVCPFVSPLTLPLTKCFNLEKNVHIWSWFFPLLCSHSWIISYDLKWYKTSVLFQQCYIGPSLAVDGSKVE